MTAFVRLPWLSISWLRFGTIALVAVVATISGVLPSTTLSPAIAQAPVAPGQPLRLESDIQEANAVTGVITARGNVRINYPARQIQATSVQAQYYSRERRIVLSGDVYILQEGNSIRGEVVTYLIDEGRFVATPNQGAQVEAIYIVPDPNPVAATPGTPGSGTAAPGTPAAPSPNAPITPDFNPKPEFKTPVSP